MSLDAGYVLPASSSPIVELEWVLRTGRICAQELSFLFLPPSSGFAAWGPSYFSLLRGAVDAVSSGWPFLWLLEDRPEAIGPALEMGLALFVPPALVRPGVRGLWLRERGEVAQLEEVFFRWGLEAVFCSFYPEDVFSTIPPYLEVYYPSEPVWQ